MANSTEADFTSSKLHALTRATHFVMKEMLEAFCDPLAPPLTSVGDAQDVVRDLSSVPPRVILSLDACLPSPLPPISTDGAMLMHSDSPDWQDKLQQATLQSRGFQKAFSCIRALMRHSLSLIVFVNLTLRTKQCCSSMGLPMMELQHGALCACSLTPRAPRRFWVPLLT